MISKFRTIHVVIIGSLACVIVIVGLYFLVLKKSYERIGTLKQQYAAREAVANRRPMVEAQLEAAKQKYRMATWKLERYMREKMPPISFQDRAQGMIALWKEHAEVLGPMIQRWPARTGVRLMSQVSVPAASVDPNAIDTSLIAIPLGAFRVTGDFRTILAHIRSWNKFNRLVKIDPVSVSGASPWMSAQYGVTVYIFPRGETGPNITMAGAGEGGGISAPMGGPPSGGMPTEGPMPDLPPPSGG